MDDILKQVKVDGQTVKLFRAWCHKLDNIEHLMWSLHDLDILTKTDKKKKDATFRRYYRWFNDGDVPRVKANGGYNCYRGMNKESIHAAVEHDLNKFLKEILTKYLKKANRHELIKHYKENFHY